MGCHAHLSAGFSRAHAHNALTLITYVHFLLSALVPSHLLVGPSRAKSSSGMMSDGRSDRKLKPQHCGPTRHEAPLGLQLHIVIGTHTKQDRGHTVNSWHKWCWLTTANTKRSVRPRTQTPMSSPFAVCAGGCANECSALRTAHSGQAAQAATAGTHCQRVALN